MSKGLAIPKWVLIVWLKISQMPQYLSASFVCPCPKVLDFNEKRLYLASVVRVLSEKIVKYFFMNYVLTLQELFPPVPPAQIIVFGTV